MSLDAFALEVLPNLDNVLEVGHSLLNIFGNILLAMHDIQRLSCEDVMYIHKLQHTLQPPQENRHTTTIFMTMILVVKAGNSVIG